MTTKRVIALVVGVAAWACGDSTQPRRPPSDLVKTGGDQQTWYFNNPLPVPLSVIALDPGGDPVPGVVITWTATSGGVNPGQSTTNASGVASTIDSLGPTTTLQMVSAGFAGLPNAVTFTEIGSAPPTTASVSVTDNAFSPSASAIQTGGTVTWTWTGANLHKLIFTSGPTPLPANQAEQSSGTTSRTITAVGTYNYTCTNHAGMNGSVSVVH